MGNSNLKVRNNEKNEVFVEHLTEVPIRSAEDALQILRSGESKLPLVEHIVKALLILGDSGAKTNLMQRKLGFIICNDRKCYQDFIIC